MITGPCPRKLLWRTLPNAWAFRWIPVRFSPTISPYPVDEEGDLTMREALSFIAVSDAGNWIITDEGKLRLIRFGDIPEQAGYLVTEYGQPIQFAGEVLILV